MLDSSEESLQIFLLRKTSQVQTFWLHRLRVISSQGNRGQYSYIHEASLVDMSWNPAHPYCEYDSFDSGYTDSVAT